MAWFGSPEAHDPGRQDAPPRTRDVTEDSEQSFPASDPPGFASDAPATDRAGGERADG